MTALAGCEAGPSTEAPAPSGAATTVPAAAPGSGAPAAGPGSSAAPAPVGAGTAVTPATAIPALRVADVKVAWTARWKVDAADLGGDHWEVKVPAAGGKPALSMMVTGKPGSPDEVWGIVCYRPGDATAAGRKETTALADDCLRTAVGDDLLSEVTSWLNKADHGEPTLRRKFTGFTGRLNLQKSSMSLALTGGDQFPA
ncbi:MAG TPA: hypothetical protein VN408_18965 [Actinoplanes sp.]|nr:hypothetical protein [Actinoplanes sp.]